MPSRSQVRRRLGAQTLHLLIEMLRFWRVDVQKAHALSAAIDYHVDCVTVYDPRDDCFLRACRSCEKGEADSRSNRGGCNNSSLLGQAHSTAP